MAVPSSDVPVSVEMIRRMVEFPTVSRDSNLDLIHFIRDHLVPFEAEVRFTYDDARGKANLFATLGPRGVAGIVLSGHTDVVPVEGQAWDADPFSLVEKDGRLYGRGTCDMKSFLAVALVLAPEFVERGLKVPLHLACSYDEEVGCVGVGRMIEDLNRAGIRPQACIVGEPTMMRPVIAHKGKKGYRCTFRGLAAHSAYAPRGANAVEAAAEAIAYLKRMARRHRDTGPFDRSFDIAHTTVHTGVVRGGTALNIVPHECTFDFEFRYLPGGDPESLLAEFERHVREALVPELRAVDPGAGVTIVPLSEIPALDTGPETEVVALAQELSGSAEIGKVSFGTEASQFQRAGIPTVVCGPGSIDQAHRPNEFVTLEQVARCEAFMRRLMDRVCNN
ncbi:MAG: acetylornithine deacetylase [Betaproteobacteria bacterium]|nr:acetylornithine deacetylase [Betaproteobacteria bacterium]